MIEYVNFLIFKPFVYINHWLMDLFISVIIATLRKLKIEKLET